VNQKLGQPCGPSRADLAVNPFSKVDDTRPYNEPPTLIANAVVRSIEGEGRDIMRRHGIADEAAGSVRVESDHEEECKVMRVPEGFETLGPYLVVSG
jgi:hypothetical protein